MADTDPPAQGIAAAEATVTQNVRAGRDGKGKGNAELTKAQIADLKASAVDPQIAKDEAKAAAQAAKEAQAKADKEAAKAAFIEHKKSGQAMQEKLFAQLSPEGKDKAIEKMLGGYGQHH